MENQSSYASTPGLSRRDDPGCYQGAGCEDAGMPQAPSRSHPRGNPQLSSVRVLRHLHARWQRPRNLLPWINRLRRTRSLAVILGAGTFACHSNDDSKVASPAAQSETRIVAAVTSSTRKGGIVTAGIHATIVSDRHLPPDNAVIRAVLTSAQALIHDSVTSPMTLATVVANGREVAVLTRYASLANPVPSYVISRSHFTWITAGPNVRLTNDQCVDPRQHYAAVPGAVGAYVCVPIAFGWQKVGKG